MTERGGKDGYVILSRAELVIQYHLGDMNLEDMIDLKRSIMNDEAFKSNFTFLIDMRNAHVNSDFNEIQKYASWLKENFLLSGKRKLAIVTYTPQQTAMTTLFSRLGAPDPLNYEIFTDVGRAISWLGIPQEHLGKILDEMASIVP